MGKHKHKYGVGAMAPPLASGRREADQLLLLLLRQNGCSVPKGISSVSQMTSDMVIEAVGSLIPALDGSPPLSEAFSTRGLHPAERHRTCKIIASKAKDAGYAEPLFAHQLLYPGKGGTRRLLLCLLSMLPADGAPPAPSLNASGPTSEQATLKADDLLSGGGDDDSEGRSRRKAEAAVVDDPPTAEGSADKQDDYLGGDTHASAVAEAESDIEALSAESGERGEVQDGQKDIERETTVGERGEASRVAEMDSNAQSEKDKAADASIIEDEKQQRGGWSACPGVENGKEEEMAGTVSDPNQEPVSPFAEGMHAEFESSSVETSKDILAVTKTPANTTAPFVGQKGADNTITTEGAGAEAAAKAIEEEEEEEGEEDDDDDDDDEENVFQQQPVIPPTVVTDEVQHSGIGIGDLDTPDDALAREKDGNEDDGPRAEFVEDAEDKYADAASADIQAEDHDVFDGNREVSSIAEDGDVGGEMVSVCDDDAVRSSGAVEGEAAGVVTAGVAADVVPTESPPCDRTTLEEGLEKQAECDDDAVDKCERDREQDAVQVRQDGGGDPNYPEKEPRGLESEAVVIDIDRDDPRGVIAEENDTATDTIDVSLDASEEVHVANISESVGVAGDTSPRGSPTPASLETGAGEEGAAVAGARSEGLQEGMEGGGGVESAVAAEAIGEEEEDVVFLQFAVEAQELELDRLLKESEAVSKTADELEEEVRRLGVLTEERETRCRYSAKALELLPRAVEEKAVLQRKCSAAEARMRSARKTFDRTRKPLEEVVRAQREELARRKVRCRALLTEMRNIYEDCEDMTRNQAALRAAAKEMEAWETGGEASGIFLIGGKDVDGDEPDWEDREENKEDIRKRKSGALLRADLDSRIGNLSEEAMGQKQEVAISVSEVLDARRETNSAWEGLGRAEALAEEKLFAVTKEALAAGANKERARELVEAYKCLHTLLDSFSALVEAVSETGKRQEECRAVEDDTDALLSEGEAAHMERLMQDLRRAQGDASALERRLDNALEEERELRRAFEADKRLRKEKEEKQQASLREQSLLREEQESARTLERVESDVGDGSLGSMKARFVNENTRGGLGAMEEGGEGQGGDGGKAEVHSVDFAGEDDDEDVWQQVDIPSREQQEDVVEG